MDRYADALYLDQARLLKLRNDAPPLSDKDLPYLEHLRHLISLILSSTRSSDSHSMRDDERPAKFQALTHSLSSDWSETFNINDWAFWASDIGREMAFEGEDSLPEDKTWKLLEKYPKIPLKAMAILSLVAFATMYGKVAFAPMYGKAELAANSSSEIATRITSLKQQPTDLGDRWRHSLSELLDRVVEVSYQVLKMEEPPLPPLRLAGHDTKYPHRLLLPSAVHKIVSVLFVCWKLVVDIMIKCSR